MKPDALSSHQHMRIKVDRHGPIPCNKWQRNTSVVLQEFVHLVLHYPILLTKNQATGRFSCIAVLGFDEGENLFIDRGQWQAIYVPLNIRREPFMIGTQAAAAGSGGEIEEVVFLDFDDARVQEDKGEPLFNERGFPTEYLQSATALLNAMKDGLRQTQAFIDRLLLLNLVAPAEFSLEFADKSKRHIHGLYTIDRERLQQLDKDDLTDLHRSGYLEAVYLMLASLGQVHALMARKNARLKA